MGQGPVVEGQHDEAGFGQPVGICPRHLLLHAGERPGEHDPGPAPTVPMAGGSRRNPEVTDQLDAFTAEADPLSVHGRMLGTIDGRWATRVTLTLNPPEWKNELTHLIERSFTPAPEDVE